MDKEILNAINKFFYFSLNYKCVPHILEFSKERVYIPEFLLGVKWHCDRNHMIGKWLTIIDKTDAYGYINKFYAELDSINRELLLNWILENYECKNLIEN